MATVSGVRSSCDGPREKQVLAPVGVLHRVVQQLAFVTVGADPAVTQESAVA
jgi:hypothetical protein